MPVSSGSFRRQPCNGSPGLCMRKVLEKPGSDLTRDFSPRRQYRAQQQSVGHRRPKFPLMSCVFVGDIRFSLVSRVGQLTNLLQPNRTILQYHGSLGQPSGERASPLLMLHFVGVVSLERSIARAMLDRMVSFTALCSSRVKGWTPWAVL